MATVTSKMVPGKGGTKRKVWLARWNEDGKRREKMFKMKRDAQSFAAENARNKEGQELTGEKVSQLQRRTFEDVAREYIHQLRHPGPGKDPREEITIRGYESLLREHIQPIMDGQGGITAQGFALFHLEQIRDGMFRKGASFDRVKKAISLVNTILRYAVRQGVRQSALPDLKLEKPASVRRQEQERADEVYDLDQLYTILRAADSLLDDRHRGTRRAWQVYRPMVYFLAYTGARIGEARAFPWAGFDTRNGKVLIRQAAREDGSIKHPKTIGGRRDIPMHDDLPDILAPLRVTSDHELAFASSKGTPRSLGNLYRGLWNPLIARANELAEKGGDSRLVPVPEWSFHAIRHAYASRLIAAGANLKQLQRWMGHSDPAFTMRVYGHLMDGTADEVMDRMKI